VIKEVCCDKEGCKCQSGELHGPYKYVVRRQGDSLDREYAVGRNSCYAGTTSTDATKDRSKIPDLTKGRVREQLADSTDPKAIKRLTATREYLEGLSPAEIKGKYG